MHFGARHAEAAIRAGPDRLRQGCEEARPTGAAVELGPGFEQRQAARGAGIHAGPMLVVERTGAGSFGAVPAHHVEGLGRQLLFPLLVGPVDAGVFGVTHGPILAVISTDDPRRAYRVRSSTGKAAANPTARAVPGPPRSPRRAALDDTRPPP